MSVDFFEKPEILLANATNFLIQGQEFKEAGILLLCEINIFASNSYNGDTELSITLSSNRAVYDIIRDKGNLSTIAIRNAFNAVLPYSYSVDGLYCLVQLTEGFSENWRIEMLEMIEGKRPLNQCIPIQEKPRFPWENLYFRSPVEVTIAKALDKFKYKVLFLPNCMARLGMPDHRENREADFLVCLDGKWGILEINGDTYHTSAAKDHTRSRLFKQHGIKVFELYEANRCIKEPDAVVLEFLKFLKLNG